MDIEQEEQVLETLAATKRLDSLREAAREVALCVEGYFEELNDKLDAIELQIQLSERPQKVWRLTVGDLAFIFVDDSFESIKAKIESLPAA